MKPPWLETWVLPPDADDEPSDEYNLVYVFVEGGDTVADFTIDGTVRSTPTVLARARLAAAAPSAVRALLAVEWNDTPRWLTSCPMCKGRCHFEYHKPECPVDFALTAAGLPTQADRDAARREIATHFGS